MKTNIILNGNALTHLKELPKKSINMVMTSPPYWALRDYGTDAETIWDEKEDCEWEMRKQIESGFCKKCGAWKGQLGLEPTFDLYIKHLCDIFDEVKRVLRDDGTCWVNLGDTYYGSGKGVGGDISKSKEVYQMPKDWKRPSRDEYVKASIKKECLICGKEFLGKENSNFCSRECLNKKGNDFRSQNRLLPDKCLTMIPMRFAIEMVNRGWILRNVIIWHKPNCMPSSTKDRFTVDFEYIFFFSKKKKYYFETQYEPLQESTIKLEGRNKRTVWKIPPKPFSEAHFAVYPEELCETPIKAGCPKQGIVLDPFFGSGTTGLVALKQGKKFIGIELNPEYIEIANKRLKPYLEQKTITGFCKKL